MMRRTITLLFFCLLVTACEDPSSKGLLSQPSTTLVVAGVITSENKNHLINLSYPYEALNGTGAPATGAHCTITVGDSVYNLTEFPEGTGNYYTPTLRAVTGKSYLLTIKLQGNSFTASDTPEPVEPLDAFQYYRTDSLYSLSLTSSGSLPDYIEYSVDWSGTSHCVNGSQCKGEVYYYDLKTTDVNEIFKPDKAGFYFPVATNVIRKKYSVSAAYRSFLRSMLSETEWRGGIFDVQPSPVGTNLTGGAIGFFAVSTVVSDTTIIVAKP